MHNANQYPYRWRDLPRLVIAFIIMVALLLVVLVLEVLHLYRPALAVCDAVDRVRIWSGIDARRRR